MNNDISEKKNNNDEIDLLDLIGVLYRHKFLIIMMTSISSVGFLFFLILTIIIPPHLSPLPNLFKPVSIVRINDETSSGGLSSLLDSSGVGAFAGLLDIGSSGVNRAAMAIKLANSNTIIDQISEEFDLRKEYRFEDSKFPLTKTRKEVKKRLSLKEDEDTGTISISYENIDRDLAPKIVNRVVNLLESKFAELDQSSNYTQRLLLEEKISDIEQEIYLLQQKILNFQNKYDILDAKTTAEIIGNKLVTLRTTLVEKEAAIATYMEKSRIQDSALIKLKDEKTAIENSLLALENGLISGIPAIKELPLIVMEYEELIRNIEVQTTIYKTLIQQNELLKLQDGGTGPIFQVIEYAEVPEKKSGPSRFLLLIVFAIASVFLSICAAFIKDFRDNLKKDPERLKKLKGLG